MSDPMEANATNRFIGELQSEQRKLWLWNHRLHILGGVIVVALVALAFGGWWYYKVSAEQESVSRYVAYLKQQILNADSDTETNENDGNQNAIDAVKELNLDEGAPSIRLLSAFATVDAYLKEGYPSKALAAIDKTENAASALGGYYRDLHRLWKAAILLDMDQSLDAIEILKELRNDSLVSDPASSFLVEAYVETGQNDSAIALLQEIWLDPTSDTLQRNSAQQALNALGVSPAQRDRPDDEQTSEASPSGTVSDDSMATPDVPPNVPQDNTTPNE